MPLTLWSMSPSLIQRHLYQEGNCLENEKYGCVARKMKSFYRRGGKGDMERGPRSGYEERTDIIPRIEKKEKNKNYK
ncbi:hypothetical protein GE21DRAFT_1094057, partial [Neurospora crassa]